jgi:hypothetical protein
MKKIKIFSALFAVLTVGFALTAFTKAPTHAPLRVIVDEIIFKTEPAANLVQDTTQSALNNLPNVYHKKDTTGTISWYDKNAPREGYFVRIEELGKKGVILLEFKLMLTPGTHKVVVYLPPANSTKKAVIKGKPAKRTKLNFGLTSKTGLTCDLTANNTGFRIGNLKGPNASAQYRITVFSKDNI